MYQDSALWHTINGQYAQGEIEIMAIQDIHDEKYSLEHGNTVYESLHDFVAEQHITEQTLQRIKRERNNLAAINHFGLQLHSSLDVDCVIDTLLSGMRQLFDAEHACIILFDDDVPIRWHTTADTTLTRDDVIAALTEGYIKQAVEAQSIVCVADSYEQRLPRLLPGRSLLIMPLHAEDHIQAVLMLTHPNAHAFNPGNEPYYALAADTSTQALHHAWLVKHMQEKEAARESVISRLVHDIRSPLMAVSASIDVIHRIVDEHFTDPTLSAFIQDSLGSGKRGLQEVTDLTNDLLDMKKIQAGQYFLDYQPVIIEFLYDEIHKLIYNLALRQHVILRYEVKPRMLKMIADVRLVRRVVVNLIANALRFSPRGGTITIKASADTSSDGVLLVVEDMGPGVPHEERKRIFLPFAQGKGEHKRGTGLGLAFCREVAMAHGGRIWVEERTGGGSRFCLLLPIDPGVSLPEKNNAA
jgi:signal transduction histidine kinase